jgi:hypothetical protein
LNNPRAAPESPPPLRSPLSWQPASYTNTTRDWPCMHENSVTSPIASSHLQGDQIWTIAPSSLDHSHYLSHNGAYRAFKRSHHGVGAHNSEQRVRSSELPHCRHIVNFSPDIVPYCRLEVFSQPSPVRHACLYSTNDRCYDLRIFLSSGVLPHERALL